MLRSKTLIKKETCEYKKDVINKSKQRNNYERIVKNANKIRMKTKSSFT